jgi:CheY-like chemotaxis protein
MVKPSKRVLIVDDEETLTWSMSKSLSKDRDKYSIFIANTGKEALEVLRNHAIDLVITDIRMPDINGLDLLTTVKRQYPGTKVIIMTAYGSPDIQKEANKRGSLYYIEKPFEIADIRKLILDILWKRRGFEGKVFDLQLTDVIQLNCLCRVTSALMVDRGDQKGVIYFSDGEIVHAECNGQVGKEALFNILRWREGKFDHERGMTPPQHTIFQNWEHLLVEGMRQSDECFVPSSQVPQPGSSSRQPLACAEKTLLESPGQSDKEETPMERTVQSIAHVTGCEGTMIVSETGDVIAHTAIENAAKEGAVVASLGLLSHRLSQILDTGELEGILLGRQKRKVILRDTP